MKFLVTISSFFLFVEIQVTSGAENGMTANSSAKSLNRSGTSQINVGAESKNDIKTEINPANLITTGVKEKTCFPRRMRSLPTYEYLERLSARADKIRKNAKQEFDAAIEEAKLLEDEIKDQVRTLLREADTEQSKAEETAEKKYQNLLEMAKKSKEPEDTDNNELEEDEEALSRAEQERQKIYYEILKKSQKKRSLASAKLRKAKAEFKKAIDEAARKAEKTVEEANRIDSYVNYNMTYYNNYG